VELPCKPWPLSKQSQGYGAIWSDGRVRLAHVVAYEEAHGPVPQGYEVDHLCHNEDDTCLGGPTCPHRACTEKTHLEAVSHRVNTLRGRSKLVLRTFDLACGNGHPWTPESTYWRKNGTKTCRLCTADRGRKRRSAALLS